MIDDFYVVRNHAPSTGTVGGEDFMSDLKSESEESVITLFEGHRLRLTREGHQIIFESHAWTSTGWKFLAAILSALVVGCDVLLGLIVLQVEFGVIVMLALLLLVFLNLGLPWLMMSSFIYARRFVFDHDDRNCIFSNVPGFGLSIPFSKIDAIDVLVLPSPNMILLGLAHSGSKCRLRMHLFWVNKYSLTEVEEVVQMITNSLSTLLDKPVRRIEKVTLGMTSWR